MSFHRFSLKWRYLRQKHRIKRRKHSIWMTGTNKRKFTQKHFSKKHSSTHSLRLTLSFLVSKHTHKHSTIHQANRTCQSILPANIVSIYRSFVYGLSSFVFFHTHSIDGNITAETVARLSRPRHAKHRWNRITSSNYSHCGSANTILLYTYATRHLSIIVFWDEKMFDMCDIQRDAFYF